MVVGRGLSVMLGVVASMNESCNFTGVDGFKYTEFVVLGGVVVGLVSDNKCAGMVWSRGCCQRECVCEWH